MLNAPIASLNHGHMVAAHTHKYHLALSTNNVEAFHALLFMPIYNSLRGSRQNTHHGKRQYEVQSARGGGGNCADQDSTTHRGMVE